jgi:hypothetical protein
MRLGLVKILIVLVIILFLFRSMSGYTGMGNQCPGCGGCPGCVKNAWGHKAYNLAYSNINPWQTVDNKVVYY